MDKVLVKALNLARGLNVCDYDGSPCRPATVDEIVSAAGRFAAFLRGENHALPENALAEVVPPPPPIPAVPIKKSIHPDYIVCLNDGKKLRMMKRHLATLGYTPESYRAYWGLPPDYPMTAPNYSAARSRLAKDIGLGTATARERDGRHRAAG